MLQLQTQDQKNKLIQTPQPLKPTELGLRTKPSTVQNIKIAMGVSDVMARD